ncbi:MAG: amidohydrolase family protein [Polyangiales bacterium]
MTAPRQPIIDAHCHVPSSRFIPRAFVEGAVRSQAAVLEAVGLRPSLSRMVDAQLAQLDDHQADGLVAAMDDAGIDHAFLLCPDFTYALGEPGRGIAEMLEAHAAIARRHPGRFSWFAGVDPRWGRDGVALFERCLRDLGAAGLKLYPPCGYSPSARALDPYYELCAAYGAPVMVHTGPTSAALGFAEAHPLQVDDAARRFPTVSFILAHAPVASGDVHVYLARFRANVYYDLSGFQSLLGDGAELCRLVPPALAHKALFGTDWPVFAKDASLAEGVSGFLSSPALAALAEASRRQLVLAGNASRLVPTLRTPLPSAEPSARSAANASAAARADAPRLSGSSRS